jgi:hypothetical protein
MTTTNNNVMTTQEVADRYNELAQQEKWFEIQEEFFAENVKSIEPEGSSFLPNAEGKSAVRKKGQDFVKRITALNHASTSAPLVAGNHFVVARKKDFVVDGLGRLQINQLMIYEVKDGKIVEERFVY